MNLAVLVIAILFLCGKCSGTVLAIVSIIFSGLSIIAEILKEF